jgi:hypothetical protein
MKTTVELADHLMTELKVIAAREHRRLRDVMEEVVALGLQTRKQGASSREDAREDAERWLSAWQELGRAVEEHAVDDRSCVEILMEDRR